MAPPLTGLIAAPFTPFHPDGELNLEPVPRLARLLAANHVTAAFVCGTTGEGSSLTLDERRRVAEAWRAALPAGLRLVVHVGCQSAGESRVLARHAQDIGAHAIASISPSFFKPHDAETLVAWCGQVAAAAPRLPFYYYHMPAMTGVKIAAGDFLARVNGQIPSLQGIKFTDEDLLDFSRTQELARGRRTILFGRDEILLSGLERGAPGAVGSTYNYASPLYQRIIEAHAAGDRAEAERQQSRARQFIDILNRFGGLSAGKAIMKFIGVDCGPVRLPLRSPDARTEESLRAELESCGFFQYSSRLP